MQQQLPDLLCPTEESGLLMLSLYVNKINALYAGRGAGGEGNAWGAGQLTLSKGPEWLGNLPPLKEGLPSQLSGFLFFNQ
jgi:hypothetical protein